MSSSYAIAHINARYPKLAAGELKSRLNHATFVNFERKYMYYAVPKAGCTTMKTLIHELEGLPPIPPLSGGYWEVRRDMFIHNRQMFQMKSLIDCTDEEQEQVLTDPEFCRFAMVRNPYTRLQSAWKDKIRPCAPGYEHFYFNIKGRLPDSADPSSLITFGEFVDEIAKEDLTLSNGHWRIQTDYMLLDAIDFSYIGRIENSAQSIEFFLEKAGYEDRPDSSAKNHTGEGDSACTPEIAEKIYHLYERDFVMLGYDKESWRSPKGDASPKPLSASEARRIGELVERNLIIGDLYREREYNRIVKTEGSLNRFRNRSFDNLFRNFIAPIDGWISKAVAEAAYDAARKIKTGCIVEIGCYRGRSTTALAIGSAAGFRVPVYTIDPHDHSAGAFGNSFGPIDRGHFMQTIVTLGLFHIVKPIGLSSEFIGASWPVPVGLLFIDGDHTYEGVKRDIESWWRKLASDAVIMINRGAFGSGVRKLVQELRAENRIKMTGQFGELALFKLKNAEVKAQVASDRAATLEKIN